MQMTVPKVKYEYFDFHKECKNMRWDRIGELIGSIEEELKQNGCVVLFSLSS